MSQEPPKKDCVYCQQPTTYSPIGIGQDTNGKPLRILRVYFCSPCSAEYVFWSDNGDLATTHLYTTIGENMYRWTLTANPPEARLFIIREPGVPGKVPNKGIERLQLFQEDILDITPSNIQEKIGFLLTWL
jgi:hypothetical protein